MNQPFDSNGRQDLMEDAPISPIDADAVFEDDIFNDSFEDDSMADDALDTEGMSENDDFDEAEDAYRESDNFDDSFDGMTNEDGNSMDSLEEIVVDVMDASTSDEFLNRLLSRMSQAAQGTPPANLTRLMQILRQIRAQGADEMDVFANVADWFEADGVDAAMPIMAGLAARVALRPMIRQGTRVNRQLYRQVVRNVTQAARKLTSRQGREAIRALAPVVRSVGRTASRRRMQLTAIPAALQRTVARIASQPTLVRRLSKQRVVQVTTPAHRDSTNGKGVPRRLVIRGPVEILIRP